MTDIATKIYAYNTKIFFENNTRFLSNQELLRYKRQRDKNQAKLFLAGKLLTRMVVSELSGIKPEKIRFKQDKYDRPKLIFPVIRNFDFNISHSGEWVGLGISNNRVGIDIEEIRSIDLKIADQYFHKKESEYLKIQNKKIENFYKIWVLKESFIKAIGQGLSYPLDKFYFIFGKGKIKLVSDSPKNWKFQIYNLDKKHKMAICLENAAKFPKPVIIKKIY